MSELAILTLSRAGFALGQRLARELGRGEVLAIEESARRVLQDCFSAGRPLVCIMALGIVVRVLGPLTRDKLLDPPVVVVDEAGRFAISVLGGHVQGANALAREVARALSGVPVITTASESLGLPAIDMIGRAWGWKIETGDNLTTLAAAMVRGDVIGVYQDAGRRDWCESAGGWPDTFVRVAAWPPAQKFAGLLVISDRSIPLDDVPPAVLYRPPSLVLGVGCRRGTAGTALEELFESVCRENGLAPLSLGMVATISLKADEPGLREFADRHGVPVRCFGADELARVTAIPTPSEKVRSKIGVAGVAEPAAILAANTSFLTVSKVRSPNATMAVARREDV